MRAGPGAVVLTYHRVSDGPDPMLQCVSPMRFAEHLARLADVAAVVPLAALDEPARERRAAITFDDGYLDNATVAAPILRDAGVPATFFVPSRTLDDGREYWWDRLEHLLAEPVATPMLRMTIDGTALAVDVRSPAGRARALRALNRRLRVLPLAEVEPLVAEVAAQLGGDGDPRCDHHRVMGDADVAGLAAHPWFEIGSHGVTHTMLSTLPKAEQEAELRMSRQRLERAAGRPVTALAYPYGVDGSFTSETEALARRAGFRTAFANWPGVVRVRTPKFRRPRVMVYDWSGDELVRRLRDALES